MQARAVRPPRRRSRPSRAVRAPALSRGVRARSRSALFGRRSAPRCAERASRRLSPGLPATGFVRYDWQITALPCAFPGRRISARRGCSPSGVLPPRSAGRRGFGAAVVAHAADATSSGAFRRSAPRVGRRLASWLRRDAGRGRLAAARRPRPILQGGALRCCWPLSLLGALGSAIRSRRAGLAGEREIDLTRGPRFLRTGR